MSSNGSPSQNEPISKTLNKLRTELSYARGYPLADTKSKETKRGVEMDMHSQLNAACNELDYVISAFERLESFEADFSKSVNILEENVTDIKENLAKASPAVINLAQSNLKVLRSNITKVKIQIPVQRQVFGTSSEARRYFPTTCATIERMPTPYMANETFESCLNLDKEFRDHYKDLDCKRKKCLTCFAIFPENAEIKKRLLRHWWIGEKLVPDDARIGEKLVPDDAKEEENVDEILGKFVEKGFIEPVTEGSYKMHPLIRSIIIRLAKEANFFNFDSKGNPIMDISASNYRLCFVESKGTTWFSRPDPKKLRQKEEQKDQKNQVEQIKEEKERIRREMQRLTENLERVQTLFNLSNEFPDFPFNKMKDVRVLCLGRWESKDEWRMDVKSTEFFTELEHMKELRFLSLQGINGISMLPESLCDLSELRILDLRACNSLDKLPEKINLLQHLTYMDLSECFMLDNMPSKLSELKQLKVLKGFVIGKKGLWRTDLHHLEALPNLEKLSVKVKNDKFSINEAGNIFSRFQALQKLKITWEARKKTEERAEIGNAQEIGMKLEKLDLQYFPERELPRWLVPENLTDLKRLYIIRWEELSNLGESWMSTNNKWKVESLRLKFLNNMKTNWKALQTQFPNLKYLEKINCPYIAFCPCDANGVWRSANF